MTNNGALIKWEYCSVNFSLKPGHVSFLQEDRIKEYPLPGRQKRNGDKSWQEAGWRYIAGLGKQGWELILYSKEGPSKDFSSSEAFFFKRPLQQAGGKKRD